jgi:hypothetical protein
MQYAIDETGRSIAVDTSRCGALKTIFANTLGADRLVRVSHVAAKGD